MDIVIGRTGYVNRDASHEKGSGQSFQKKKKADRRKNKRDRRKGVRDGVIVTLSTIGDFRRKGERKALIDSF